MSNDATDASRARSGGGRFQTTHWSLVLAARDRATPEAEGALADLCAAYWYPLYAFVRRKGHDPEHAADLTQEFFARLLEKDYLRSVDRSKGRFRSFLLAACTHFLANERDRATARKRGGGRPPVSIDVRDAEGRYLAEPAHGLTAERLFERRWALTLLERRPGAPGRRVPPRGQGRAVRPAEGGPDRRPGGGPLRGRWAGSWA